MAISYENIKALAQSAAKSCVEYMLRDLAKGIRARAKERLTKSESCVALNIVADEIEKIDMSKYFS